MKHYVTAKRLFDCTSKEDLLIFQQYLETGGWKNGCPFKEEWPFVTVPDTIYNKIVKHYMTTIQI